MSEHRIDLAWAREGHPFTYEGHSRKHTVRFSGGQTISASSAPAFFGDATLANPEELLVAALSSCHMLTFLAVAAKRGFVVERYEDAAVGVLEKNAEGKIAVTRVSLRPVIAFGGDKQPGAEELDGLHHRAHQNCMIANSVRTVVTIEH
jgi:organic hydroperoxide reductase OsmC/OhrA